MNKKKISRILAGALATNSIVNLSASPVYAMIQEVSDRDSYKNSTDGSSDNYNAEDGSGVSVEQMQNDFENFTNEFSEESTEESTEENEIPDGTIIDGEEYVEPSEISALAEENINENVKTGTLASFSFDGDNAGRIVITQESLDEDVQFRYSLDGGNEWITTSDRIIQLSDDQINSITTTNGIRVGISGQDSYETIVIRKATAPAVKTVYKNDLENRFFGSLENLQVSTDSGKKWEEYDPSRSFGRDKLVVQVRYKAHGTYLASDSVQYTFTADTDTANSKYVSISDIKLAGFCSEETSKENNAAKNLIDGNGNTIWHNSWAGTDRELFYTVMFDEVKFINKIEYVPTNGVNGKLKSGRVLASHDNTNWEVVGTFEGLANNTNTKTISLEFPTAAKYIRLEATETWGARPNIFFSGNMLNFYEDSTLEYSNEASIVYSTKEETTGSVTAKLILPAGCTAEEKTHKFLKNGSYTFYYTDSDGSTKSVTATVENIIDVSTNKGVYLSDLHETSVSVGYGSFMKDKNPSGGTISVLVNGYKMSFSKGLGVHASGNVIYDIEPYAEEYSRFTGYLGVDSSRGSNGSVAFTVSASKDGKVWTELQKTGTLKGTTESVFVDVSVQGYSYLKIYADATSDGNGNDHSVIADARLVKSDYDINSEVYTGFKTLAQYDKEISSRSVEVNYAEHKKEILEREFVNRIGYGNIISYAREDESIASALNWLLEDEDALQLFIEAGTFEFGNGERAIKALGALYKEYKGIIGNEDDAYVYKKMLIATAVAYSRQIMTFMTEYYKGSYVESDPVKRFAIYKNLYDSDLLAYKEDFANYEMELLRAVMDAKMDDNDIYWVRKYTEQRYPKNLKDRFYIYNYMKYLTPNYNGDDLYSEGKREEWDKKYSLTEYGFTGYGEKYRHRLWMLFEKGGICWTISNAGLNIQEAHGIPGVNIYQPGHEAYLTYSKNEKGEGIWSIGNTIGNWENSFSYWYGLSKNQARLLLGWGNRSYNSNGKNNGSYMLLAQAALNRYEDFKKSMYYNLLANSYENGSESREECYKKALECLEINLDSIDGLISSYKASGKPSEEWFKLGKKIAEVYKYYPLPMVEAIDRILPNVTDNLQKAELNMLKTNSLYEAKVATNNESIQADACRRVASSLIGTQSFDLASFSFDGENAGVIKLHESYNGMDVRIRYSLDGGTHYEEVKGTEVKLTEEQLASITPDKDIKVGLVGASAVFTIDILDSGSVSGSIYLNDDENLLIGGNLNNVEYSLDNGDTWQDYVSGLNSDTRIEGTVTALFRYKAHGVYTRGASTAYKFTENGDTNTSKYIQLRNISLYKYSSQQNGTDKAAANLFDGNYNTRWHNTWNWKDTEKYISVEFDKVRFISKLSYLSYDASGRLKDGNIYTSLDGKTWTKVCEYKDLLNTTGWKTIDLGGSFAAKYVKIDSTQSHGLYNDQKNLYVSGRMLNFYEDTTKEYKAEVSIKYSTTEATNQEVVAELVLSEGCTAEELTYTFESNGTHDFTYLDANGVSHTITAEVNNIDKSLPEMEYEFDINEPTTEDVTMTITKFNKDGVRVIGVKDLVAEETPSEEDIANDEGFTSNDLVVDEGFNFVENEIDSEFGVLPNTYTFTENKTVIFTIQDSLGNIANVPVTVDWIDREIPTAEVVFDSKALVEGKVIARLVNPSEKIIITNTVDGSDYYEFKENGEFTFEFKDEAGNKGSAKVVVDWLDFEKEEEVKDVISFTGGFKNEDVKPEDGKFDFTVATVNLDKEKFQLIGEEGKVLETNTFKFTENGTYTIRARMVDTGEEFDLIVEVDWLTGGKGEMPIIVDEQVPPTEEGGETSGGDQTSDEEDEEQNSGGNQTEEDSNNENGQIEENPVDEDDSDKEDADAPVVDENPGVPPVVDNPVIPPVTDNPVTPDNSTDDPNIEDSQDGAQDDSNQPPVDDSQDDPETGHEEGGDQTSDAEDEEQTSGGNQTEEDSTEDNSDNENGQIEGNPVDEDDSDKEDANAPVVDENPVIPPVVDNPVTPDNGGNPVIPDNGGSNGNGSNGGNNSTGGNGGNGGNDGDGDNPDDNSSNNTPDNPSDVPVETPDDSTQESTSIDDSVNDDSTDQETPNTDDSVDSNYGDSSKDDSISNSDYSDVDSNNVVEESSTGFIATVISVVSATTSAIFVLIKRLLGIHY